MSQYYSGKLILQSIYLGNDYRSLEEFDRQTKLSPGLRGETEPVCPAGFQLCDTTSVRPITKRNRPRAVPDRGDRLPLRRTQRLRAGYIRSNRAIYQPASRPAEIDLKYPSRTQPLYRAFGPRLRKRRQKINASLLALQQ